MRGIAHGRVGGWRRHQGAALIQPAQWRKQAIHAQRTASIQTLCQRRTGDILTQRGEQNQRIGRRRAALLQPRTDCLQRLAQQRRQIRLGIADPHRRPVGDRARRQRRLGIEHWRTLGIDIKTTPGLAPVEAGRHLRPRQRRGLEARLVIELLIDRIHHRQTDIQPDQVGELERPHAKTGHIAQDAIDRLHIGHALGQDAQALGREAAPGMVDDEAGQVARQHPGMPEASGQRQQGVADPGLGEGAGHHLNDLHQRHRIEKMPAGHAPRKLAGSGHGGHRQRGRVRGQDGVLAQHRLQRHQQLALDLQPLDNRLDHQIALGQRGQAVGRLQTSQRVLQRHRRDAAFVEESLQHFADGRAGGGHRSRLLIEQAHPDTRLRGNLRDAAPHGAAAHDTDAQRLPLSVPAHWGSLASLTHGGGSLDRGRHDVGVAGATAQMTANHLAQLLLAGRRIGFQIVRQRHQDAGGAVAALQREIALEGLLQQGQFSVGSCQPFHSLDLAALGLHRQRQTGAHRLAIDAHGAGTAHSMLAADVGTGGAQLMPDKVRQQHARLGPAADLTTIQFQ